MILLRNSSKCAKQ